jgi:hypothetical protein
VLAELEIDVVVNVGDGVWCKLELPFDMPGT